MEFNVKLQELRKQKGLTQEELAEALFVSRTAVSKWESGRGYPNLDSLKAIAKFFSVTVDDLLSGEELLTMAQKEGKQRARDVIFGLLDIFTAFLLFLPVFAQRGETGVQAVSLLSLSSSLRVPFVALICIMILVGVLSLAFQNIDCVIWEKNKRLISLLLNVLGAVLFIVSLHPYAAVYLFVFLIIKVLLFVKKA